MSDGPVEIIRLPEGESGVSVGNLSKAVIESLAAYWSIPESVRRKRFGDNEVSRLASRLGIAPGTVRKHTRDPRVLRAIRKRLDEALTLLMPSIDYAQVQAAVEKNDTRAARYVAERLGWLKAGGVNVSQSVNVTVGPRSDGGIAEDTENLQKLRALRESGDLDRLLGRVEQAGP